MRLLTVAFFPFMLGIFWMVSDFNLTLLDPGLAACQSDPVSAEVARLYQEVEMHSQVMYQSTANLEELMARNFNRSFFRWPPNELAAYRINQATFQAHFDSLIACRHAYAVNILELQARHSPAVVGFWLGLQHLPATLPVISVPQISTPPDSMTIERSSVTYFRRHIPCDGGFASRYL